MHNHKNHSLPNMHTQQPWRHNSYRFSHDLSFLLCFRKSFVRIPLAILKEPFRCSLWVLCASCSSTAPGSCFSLIWLSTPTKSSSTWWLRAADVSAYFESYWFAAALASVIMSDLWIFIIMDELSWI